MAGMVDTGCTSEYLYDQVSWVITATKATGAAHGLVFNSPGPKLLAFTWWVPTNWFKTGEGGSTFQQRLSKSVFAI
jgi:hypothetical protein